jgi:hydrolase, NUDIX family
VTETGDMWAEGAHRPAKLYRFNSSELEIFNFISL